MVNTIFKSKKEKLSLNTIHAFGRLRIYLLEIMAIAGFILMVVVIWQFEQRL